jgi:hypothetical protein
MVESSAAGEAPPREFTFGGGPCWAPAIDRTLSTSEQALVMGFALETISAQAVELGAGRALMQLSPLVPAFDRAARIFVTGTCQFGYLDRTINTKVIDLTLSDEQILSTMTHGHRQSITRAQRCMDIRTSTSPTDFDVYRELHRLAAGRQTRPSETFDLMRGWLDSGNALVALAEIDGKPAGAILAIVFGDGAYYASAANAPEFRRYPLGHGLQWAVMRQLRARGVKRYETGTVQPLPLPHSILSDKERAIGRFKANFGGSEMPVYGRERFFSPALAECVLKARMDEYLAALGALPYGDAIARP